MKKLITLLLVALLLLGTLSGCMTREADKVNHNMNVAADNFSCKRRMCCGAEEFNKLLEEYTEVKARPYTAYQYFDLSGDYIGDSNENDLYDLLRAAYVEVRDG